MPIVFTATVPHPPILIKEIGKDHLKKIKKTQTAFKTLEQELYAAKPESILIIAQHGNILADAFNINLNADYTGGFKEFGDFGIQFKFRSDYMTIQNIRAGDEMHKKVPITLTSEEEIDYGFSVPLSLLTQHLKNLPVVPITTSGLDLQQHFDFGKFLNEQLAKIDKRIAVIASADLSHKLTKDAPAGFSKDAKAFDEKIIAAIKKNDVETLLKIKEKETAEVGEAEIKPIITLLGIINSINFRPEVLSYEGPFGVGYLLANFKFS
ncbi:MAG: AmmeMemoRadiSam system protein B [Candidatus Buchananbacteria bacterium]|nr:AmmeMemoRadiSam system protein B [Candidatus Buchananbacteria bacterium]